MANAKPNYSKSNTIGKLYSGSKPACLKIKTKGKPKKTILPVIYTPGIFASRIQKSNGESLWDPDDTKSMKSAFLNGLVSSVLGIDVNWTEDEIDTKTEFMHSKGKVLDKHHDGIIDSILSRIKRGKPYKRLLERSKIDPWLLNDDTDADDSELKCMGDLANLEYARRQERGWYEILKEYADIMEHIYMLEHKDFLFPTYGFGFDWRDDLKVSAEHFVKRIDQALSQTKYPDFGTEKQDYLIDPAQKVIIVTHSMGSIMSRYASEILGASSKIHSIIHLNQPTTGAPILYRRFVGGTTDEKRFPFSISAIGDNVFSEILGNNSYHFTRMAGPLAGALQLLPTNDHTSAETKDKKWLQIKDPRIASKVTDTDIYKIYKSEAAGLISCKRYDNSGNLKPYTKEEFKRVAYSDDSDEEQMFDLAKNISPETLKSYDTVEYYYNEPTPYTKDNYRLRGNSLNFKEMKKALEISTKIHKNIDGAATFHSKLRLKHHPKTFVVASEGKKTINYVELQLNSDNIIDMPYKKNLAKAGDGTVPLTSQEALLNKSANRAGPIVTPRTQNESKHKTIGNTDVTHSKMPSNRNAIAQVLSNIEKLTESIKPVKVNSP